MKYESVTLSFTSSSGASWRKISAGHGSSYSCISLSLGSVEPEASAFLVNG
ncbi:hypothetical protein FQZ97_507850 [compost metagenome]